MTEVELGMVLLVLIPFLHLGICSPRMGSMERDHLLRISMNKVQRKNFSVHIITTVRLPYYFVTLHLPIFSVGMHKILSLLESDDPNVRIHAVKVVANLAAEGIYDAIYSYYSLL